MPIVHVGYQGSETSRVEVIIYTRNEEPFFTQFPAGATTLDGATNRDVGRPSVVEATTTKTMGGGAGTFKIMLKAETTADIDRS